jgi:hypothetical protein
MKAASATVAAITHGFVLGFQVVIGAVAAAAAMVCACSYSRDPATADVQNAAVIS